MNRSLRRNAGFTLMEILIALGIFVIAVSSIMSLFMVAASTHKRAIDNTRAATLAESLLSEMQADVKRGKILGTEKGKRSPDYPGITYDIVIQRVNPNDRYEAKVTIVIRWKREGKDRSESFETLIQADTAN